MVTNIGDLIPTHPSCEVLGSNVNKSRNCNTTPATSDSNGN